MDTRMDLRFDGRKYFGRLVCKNEDDRPGKHVTLTVGTPLGRPHVEEEVRPVLMALAETLNREGGVQIDIAGGEQQWPVPERQLVIAFPLDNAPARSEDWVRLIDRSVAALERDHPAPVTAPAIGGTAA